MKIKRPTQCPLAAGIKKFSSHCRQRCNPSPEISVGLKTFRADQFNFGHFLRLKPGRFRPESVGAATVSDHINSHRQTWNTWKYWLQRVPESKLNGAKVAINHQKLPQKCLLTSLETLVHFAVQPYLCPYPRLGSAETGMAAGLAG